MFLSQSQHLNTNNLTKNASVYYYPLVFTSHLYCHSYMNQFTPNTYKEMPYTCIFGTKPPVIYFLASFSLKSLRVPYFFPYNFNSFCFVFSVYSVSQFHPNPTPFKLEEHEEVCCRQGPLTGWSGSNLLSIDGV